MHYHPAALAMSSRNYPVAGPLPVGSHQIKRRTYVHFLTFKGVYTSGCTSARTYPRRTNLDWVNNK
eukprot:2654729-Pyramimonas_sp.AAC.1